MKIDLGKILARAWEINWKHRVLWIFGIFAGFANGGGNGGSSNSSSGSTEGDPSSFLGDANRFTEQAGEFFQQYLLVIIAVCLVLVLLSFAFYALGMMGRIGLLKGVYKVESGADTLLFAELWSESMPYFGRFFFINFLIGVAYFIFLMALLLPVILLGAATAGMALLCVLPILCILLPISWAVNIILEQAQAALVAEDLSIVEALKRGWEIARSDVGGMIVLSLVLGIGGGVVGTILALPLLAAAVPFVISILGAESGASLSPLALISLVCCVVYLPVLIGLSGILTSYTKTAWALSYLQLTIKPQETLPLVAQADA